MSAATKQNLEDAIAAHLVDESDGAIIAAYFLSAHGQRIQDEPGGGSYILEWGDNQLAVTTLGVLHHAVDTIDFEYDDN